VPLSEALILLDGEVGSGKSFCAKSALKAAGFHLHDELAVLLHEKKKKKETGEAGRDGQAGRRSGNQQESSDAADWRTLRQRVSREQLEHTPEAFEKRVHQTSELYRGADGRSLRSAYLLENAREVFKAHRELLKVKVRCVVIGVAGPSSKKESYDRVPALRCYRLNLDYADQYERLLHLYRSRRRREGRDELPAEVWREIVELARGDYRQLALHAALWQPGQRADAGFHFLQPFDLAKAVFSRKLELCGPKPIGEHEVEAPGNYVRELLEHNAHLCPAELERHASFHALCCLDDNVETKCFELSEAVPDTLIPRALQTTLACKLKAPRLEDPRRREQAVPGDMRALAAAATRPCAACPPAAPCPDCRRRLLSARFETHRFARWEPAARYAFCASEADEGLAGAALDH